NHLGVPYLYVAVLFLIAAPWSGLLPATLIYRSDKRSADRLACSYFAAVFLLFTLSASRRSYYLLPILPATALLEARLLAASSSSLRPWARRLRTTAYGVLMAGAIVSGMLLVPARFVLPAPYDSLPALPAWWLFLLGWVVAMAGIVAVLAGRLEPHQFIVAA